MARPARRNQDGELDHVRAHGFADVRGQLSTAAGDALPREDFAGQRLAVPREAPARDSGDRLPVDGSHPLRSGEYDDDDDAPVRPLRAGNPAVLPLRSGQKEPLRGAAGVSTTQRKPVSLESSADQRLPSAPAGAAVST